MITFAEGKDRLDWLFAFALMIVASLCSFCRHQQAFLKGNYKDRKSEKLSSNETNTVTALLSS